MGAPILTVIPKGVKDLIDISLLELEEGVLPITIRRSLPDGTYQDIPLGWLVEKKTPSLQDAASSSSIFSHVLNLA